MNAKYKELAIPFLFAAILCGLVLYLALRRDPHEGERCAKYQEARHSWGSHYRTCVRWESVRDPKPATSP